MEFLRADAIQALAVAERKLREGDIDSARRFALKSIRVYETREAQQFLKNLETSSNSKTENKAGNSSHNSKTRRNADSSGMKQRFDKTSNSSKDYTTEQKKIVDRIRKYKHTQYYEILDLKKNAPDIEIKRSYRRLALLLHPDKNSAPGADEAFKLVSKAFQILSDPAKRKIFDSHGVDPDLQASKNSSSTSFSYGQDELSPEDLFNLFFGSGFVSPPYFGGNAFDIGQFSGSFRNNGIHFQQFGFSPSELFRRDRRRRQHYSNREHESRLSQFIPLLVLIMFSMIYSFLSGSSKFSSAQSYSMELHPPYTELKLTPDYNIPFYIKKEDLGISKRKLRNIARAAEKDYISTLREKCEEQWLYKQREINRSYDWFGRENKQKMRKAKAMPIPDCDRLRILGLSL